MSRGALLVTWLGHSTVMIEADGVSILTDPALTTAMAHLRRRRPVARPAPPDVVAVSHLHMDHLHRRSLRRVGGLGTELLVPVGAAPLVNGLGFGTVHEMRVGDSVAAGRAGSRVCVDAVHAQHSGRRGPHSRLEAPALGYVVRGGSASVYFAGDTGLFDGMADIGPVDVALVPIWGWGPTLGERHLNPTTAASATALLQAHYVIPIHWGTYSPVRTRRGSPPWLDDPLDAFRSALEEVDLGDRLVPLWPGQSFTLQEDDHPR